MRYQMHEIYGATGVSPDTVAAWSKRGILKLPPVEPGHGKAQRYSLANIFEIGLVRWLSHHGLPLDYCGDVVSRKLTDLGRKDPLRFEPADFAGTDFNPQRGFILPGDMKVGQRTVHELSDHETAHWKGERDTPWLSRDFVDGPLTYWVVSFQGGTRRPLQNIDTVGFGEPPVLAVYEIAKAIANGSTVICVSYATRKICQSLFGEQSLPGVSPQLSETKKARATIPPTNEDD
ncbi:MAG: MerR family transcriptional regulator [Pseudomonadota bacterium]